MHPRQVDNSDADQSRNLEARRTTRENACAEVDLGPAETAWWEVPLPCCFDCRGRLEWCEADALPGTRRCVNCGAVFNVVSTSDGRVRLRRERLYQ